MSSPNPASVLVVDDDPIHMELACCLLEAEGCVSHRAATMSEAESLLNNLNIDMALLDIVLPDGSGLDLMKRVRQRQPQLPMIMLTGLNQIDIAVECFKKGAADFLSKPINPQKFRESVRGVLANLDEARQQSVTQKLRVHPTEIAGYQVESVIGEGNMGIVYLVRGTAPTGESGTFAMKVLKRIVAGNTKSLIEAKKRFLSEAKAALVVSHENIIRVLDYGTRENNMPFILMEYFPSSTLDRYLQEHDCTIVEKCWMLQQLAAALGEIHKHQIYHRDVKPSNVLVSDAMRVKLMDFGIARLRGSSLTVTGDVFGTPSYLSPEGFDSAKTDHRSDIFSLGSVAYRVLTGKTAFEAGGVAAVANLICNEEPPPLLDVAPTVPPALAKMVRKMHRKDPERRYQNATEIADELGDVTAEIQRQS